ncbi:MAG: insulinase family protein [Phycisphaerales bacterium]|nr:insulinase family protein [Phycisphaerales bacterium]
MSFIPPPLRSSRRTLQLLFLLTAAFLIACTSHSNENQKSKMGGGENRKSDGLAYSTETLDNGLTVIYAPIPTSPVTHVRVLYHVGSKDERPDRQGFAHMFEHMMFRGSEHVAPEEHMKLVGQVGGYSNAFTSFDQTVYYNTVPHSYAPMALWLEADRMSSFKVSPEIFHTERKVVTEEWRLRRNQPYGTLFEDLFAAVFTTHSYRWTPIGNMDHLAAADAGELQAFFNKYYIPNNAILVVSGHVDLDQTKKLVRQYFNWIPKGEPFTRVSPKEPEQTEPRRVDVTMKVPLPRVILAYHMPPERSTDIDAIGLMMAILGDGQSSRLSRALVTNENPLCMQADTIVESLEDGGFMGVMATPLAGKAPAAVEKILREQIAAMRNAPVTPEELEKVKQQQRVELAKRWETAESAASVLGEEMLLHGNLDRVASARARLEAITTADIQRVAKMYLADNKATTFTVHPGTPAPEQAATAPFASALPPIATATPRKVNFPADYPTSPPMSGKLPAAIFEKGTEELIHGVHVIVMEDHRIPIVNWTLTFRQGGHVEPAGKEGLAAMTADMVRRGPKGKSFDQFNDDLESRGIDLGISDGGDYTEVSGPEGNAAECLKEQFPYAVQATHDMLATPAFDPAEFDKLKAQTLSALRLSLTNTQQVAGRELKQALYGDSPLGRHKTPATIQSITLDDVKQFYNAVYRIDNAVLMISGDITIADGQAAAEKMLAGLQTGQPPKATYSFPAIPAKRNILLIDRPESKQSTIRMGIRAYDITSNDKYPGSLASQMLSSGIDSRLGKYVRAEKGYAYDVAGYFRPGRQAGAFFGSTDTKCETTADAIEAMFRVFNDMRTTQVPAKELADAQFRVAGQLLMSTQTIQQQAAQRVAGILNNYPIDYYDNYAQRIGQVTTDEVKAVMNKYVLDGQMTIIIVAPAATVKPQLEKLGKVEVQPMPATE